MDPVGLLVGKLLFSLFVAWLLVSDGSKHVAARLTGREEQFEQERAQRLQREHEARMAELRHRHEQVMAGAARPRGETAAEAFTRLMDWLAAERERMGPLRGWWNDRWEEAAAHAAASRQRRREQAPFTQRLGEWVDARVSAAQAAHDQWVHEQWQRHDPPPPPRQEPQPPPGASWAAPNPEPVDAEVVPDPAPQPRPVVLALPSAPPITPTEDQTTTPGSPAPTEGSAMNVPVHLTGGTIKSWQADANAQALQQFLHNAAQGVTDLELALRHAEVSGVGLENMKQIAEKLRECEQLANASQGQFAQHSALTTQVLNAQARNGAGNAEYLGLTSTSSKRPDHQTASTADAVQPYS